MVAENKKIMAFSCELLAVSLADCGRGWFFTVMGTRRA